MTSRGTVGKVRRGVMLWVRGIVKNVRLCDSPREASGRGRREQVDRVAGRPRPATLVRRRETAHAGLWRTSGNEPMLVGAKTGREQGTAPVFEMAPGRTVQRHLLPLKGQGS